MFAILSVIVIIIQLIWAAYINYPPSYQQINLIPFGGDISLWIIRLLSLVLLLISIKLISGLLDKKYQSISSFLIIISPVISVLFLTSPVDCLKIFIFATIVHNTYKQKLNIIFGLLIFIGTIIIINKYALKQSVPFFNAINISETQFQITDRISKEDSINPHTNFPLWFRRTGYNKYFITLQNLFQKALKFWDQESIFFQEVHPLNQKSIVIFFWPEAILFFLALFTFFTTKDQHLYRLVKILLIFSWIYFILTDDSTYKQLIFTLFLISPILTIYLQNLLQNKKTITIGYIFTILIIYSVYSNFTDMFVRPLYWLDNRPVVYQKLLDNEFVKNSKNYNKIYLTSIIGNADSYCKYYVNQCDNYIFDNFNLSIDYQTTNSLYLGFIGNYLGKKDNNIFELSQLKDFINFKRIEILNTSKINDTVANQYGNDLIISKTK